MMFQYLLRRDDNGAVWGTVMMGDNIIMDEFKVCGPHLTNAAALSLLKFDFAQRLRRLLREKV